MSINASKSASVDVVVDIIFVELVELGELSERISHEWNSSLAGFLADAGDVVSTDAS